MEPYSVYIHIPFCRSRCAYCDFTTAVVDPIPEESYVSRVVDELSVRRASPGVGIPGSVYLGGGTPSVLSAGAISTVLGAAGVTDGMEVTVEMNPGDANREWLAGVREGGANRLSIGIQAMDDTRLEWMGRRHTVEEAQLAVADAHAAGFENVSVDFIYGTPSQSIAGMEAELLRLGELGATHISAYELTVARGTPLSRMKGVAFPGDELLSDMWQHVGQCLGEMGYARYEVSNYARDGHFSRHNNQYWDGGGYIGAGVGAHGFVATGDQWTRYVNTPSLEDYLGSDGETFGHGAGRGGSEEGITSLDRARERIMLGLRRQAGIFFPGLRHVLLPDQMDQLVHFDALFDGLVSEGLAIRQDDRICPTEEGMVLADTLALRFF